MVNGQYTNSVGNFKWDRQEPIWYPDTTKKITLEPNEILIHRYK